MNPAITLRLQSQKLVGRVAELGSLIWLEYVKRTVTLLSENLHIFSAFFTAAFLSQRQERVTAVINAEMRESTRWGCQRSYQQVTVRRGAWLSLGTRIGLGTALNDRRG